MRCLLVTVAVLAMTAQAHIGADPNGEKAFMPSYWEQYLMCGKCVHGGEGGGGSSPTKPWYKLVCDTRTICKGSCVTQATQTKSSQFASLSSGCSDDTCTSCDSTVPITIGQEIGAAFTGRMYPYTRTVLVGTELKQVLHINGGKTAASIQCCPQVIQTVKYLTTDTQCAGYPQYSDWQVAGCELGVDGGRHNLSNVYSTRYCRDDVTVQHNAKKGHPVLFRSHCTGNDYLKPGDSCPTAHPECLSTLTGVSNSQPNGGNCFNIPAGNTFNGTAVNMTGVAIAGITSGEAERQFCHIDGQQMCIRAVLTYKYLANMTPGTDDISVLTCDADNTGGKVGSDWGRRTGGGAASAATFAVAIAVAVASLF